MRQIFGYIWSKFQSRLGHVSIFVDIVNTNKVVDISWDCWDLLRFVFIKTFWVWKWWRVLRYWEILTRKSTYFSIEIETNWQEMPKFLGLNELLHWDRDFWVWTLILRWKWGVSILIEICWLSRQTFWQCRDKLRPPGLLNTFSSFLAVFNIFF